MVTTRFTELATVSVYTMSRIIRAGAIGGIAGALVQGLIGFALTQSVGEEIFFVTIARMVGFGDASLAGGWGLHLLTGLIIGVIFLEITTRLRRFNLTSMGKSAGLGAVAGIVVWIIFFMPVLSLALPAAPIRVDLLIGSLILHVIYGSVTGSVARSLLR